MHRYKFQIRLVGSVLCALLIAGCNRTSREADLGSHHVTVLPYCQHSWTHSQWNQESDGTSKILFCEFTCGDTTVRLDGNALTVNGKSYGSVNEGDEIAINYGYVRVNSTARTAH